MPPTDPPSDRQAYWDEVDRVARIEERAVAERELREAHAVGHMLAHAKEEEARRLAYNELQRRLDILNHAHEEARRKETDFASKSEVAVLTADLVRRIESVQESASACLTREAYDIAHRELVVKVEGVVTTMGTYVSRDLFDANTKSITDKVEVAAQQIANAAYVTREFFDRHLADEAEVTRQLRDQLAVTYSDISNMKGRSAAYSAALAVFFTIVSIAVGVLMRVLG